MFRMQFKLIVTITRLRCVNIYIYKYITNNYSYDQKLSKRSTFMFTTFTGPWYPILLLSISAVIMTNNLFSENPGNKLDVF